MFEIVKEPVKPRVKPMDIGRAVNEYRTNPDAVIAYVTAKGNGLGILVDELNTVGKVGFIYHSNLIQNRTSDVKFIAPSIVDSIHKAMDAGRTVMLFSNFQEFLRYAASMTNPQY